MATANNPFSAMPSYTATASTATTATSRPNTAPRIMYFITRHSGLPIPLIPADELPFSVKLQNVSRILSPDQTCGLQYCGNAPYAGRTFQLESNGAITSSHETSPLYAPAQRPSSEPLDGHPHQTHSRIQSSPYLAPDAWASQNHHANSTPSRAETARSWHRISTPHRTPTPPSAAGASDPAQCLISAVLRNDSGAETARRIGYRRPATSPPSGIVPDHDKKEYCTYWILNGDCAYVQQGCRYKHEMPARAKLAEIGINHVPRWWLERSEPTANPGESARKERAGIMAEVGKKPEEWLGKRRKTSDSSESESSVVDRDGSVVGEEESEGEGEGGSESPVIPPARPPSPAAEGARRTSSGSIDLIQFAPLLPTPSPPAALSASTPVTPPSSVELPKRIPEPAAAEGDVMPPQPATKTTKVFVPAGESPEKHVAEVKKREQRERAARSKPTRTPTPLAEEEKPSKTVAAKEIKVKDGKSAVLPVSRWAPSEKGESVPRQGKQQRTTQSGCRLRRPASSSLASVKGNEKATR